MKSIKVCEYSRSRSFHDDLILQDQASGERSQDQWSSGCSYFFIAVLCLVGVMYNDILYNLIWIRISDTCICWTNVHSVQACGHRHSTVV